MTNESNLREIRMAMNKINDNHAHPRIVVGELYLQFKMNYTSSPNDYGADFWSDFCEYCEEQGLVRKINQEETKEAMKYDFYDRDTTPEEKGKLDEIVRRLIIT
jgi:hypothetical protein